MKKGKIYNTFFLWRDILKMPIETNSPQPKKPEGTPKTSSAAPIPSTNVAQKQNPPSAPVLPTTSSGPPQIPPNTQINTPVQQPVIESEQKKKHAWWFWVMLIIGVIIVFGVLAYFFFDNFTALFN